MKNSNVVDFELYQFRNRAKQAADLWNSLLEEDEVYGDEDLEDLLVEYLSTFVFEPANDNTPDDLLTFEDLLELFLPETKQEYEKIFKPLLEDTTKDKIWYDADTGDFDFQL